MCQGLQPVTAKDLPERAQHSWFRTEMESRLDRSATPWVLLVFHAPV